MLARFVFVGAALLLVPTLLLAEDAGESQVYVQAGEYSDLGFWRTMRLATAAFVNPGGAKTAAVAYRYPLGTYSDMTIRGLLNQGVVFGKVDGSAVIVPQKQNLEQLLPLVEADPADYVLVSASPVDALGQGDAIVSWEPQPMLAVAPPVPH